MRQENAVKESSAERLSRMLKPVAFACVFVIIGGGRWVNLFLVDRAPSEFAAEWAVVFGAIGGLMIYQMVDLFLAKGFLQWKIVTLKALSLFAVAVIVCNHFLLEGKAAGSRAVFLVEALLTGALGVWVLLAERAHAASGDRVINPDPTLPGRYMGRHPLRTLFESLFRLFPRPEPIGLYRIGNPDSKSMVIVTGNYELTIRRVVKALERKNCWLLVCDSRGINIWCSTLANHFSTDRIIDAVILFRLHEKVEHRRLILPQLSAANVSLDTIREQTGFVGRFGPVRIGDLDAYLLHPKNRTIRKVSFPTAQRLEMAAGTLFIPTVVAIFVLNFINPHMLLVLLPAVYALSFFNALVFPHRLIANVRMWSLVFSLAVFLIVYVSSDYLLGIHGLGYAVAIGIGMAYLVNDFEGWSPLVKFSVTSAYLHACIEIDQEKCNGCATCMDVCPKAVYSVTGGKSTVADPTECISCKSCLSQCPTGAIDHSASTINEALA